MSKKHHKPHAGEANGFVEGWDVQLPGMLRLKPQEPSEGGKFCMGFGWVLGEFGVKWCQVNSNMFTRFGFEQIVCQQMPCFLQMLAGNFVVGPDFGSKTACLCTVGPTRDVLFRCQILDVCIQDCVAALCLLRPLVSAVATFLT